MTTRPPIEFTATDVHAGERLDRALASAIDSLSRARIQALVREGAVSLDGRTISEPGRRVKPGERFVIQVPEPEPAAPPPEDIPLFVVYEDDAIIVIDKPAGLVVHPAAGHPAGTLVNALIAHCGDSLSGIGGVRRPGIVHRLDKDTSGLLVVAKTDAAHQALSDQFRAHGADGRLERRYRAVVWGVPLRPTGTIEAPLARSRSNRTKISVSEAGYARHAVTHFEVLERFLDASGQPVAALLDLLLETGRTHQIRVHLAHVGHPVMGDATYGAGFRTSAARLNGPARDCLERLDRQALHAAKLAFEHPETGQRMSFESAFPEDMARLIDELRAMSRSLPRKKTP